MAEPLSNRINAILVDLDRALQDMRAIGIEARKVNGSLLSTPERRLALAALRRRARFLQSRIDELSETFDRLAELVQTNDT